MSNASGTRAFETIGHREAVERLRALRAQALRDVDAELRLESREMPNELQAALGRLEQVDKDIRREEIRAMQGWHHANADKSDEGTSAPEALDPGKGGRAAMRADAIGFIGRTLVVLSQRAGMLDFYPQCAILMKNALAAVRAGQYEDAIAATELALVTEGRTPLNREGAPTRWELAAELVEVATKHVRHA